MRGMGEQGTELMQASSLSGNLSGAEGRAGETILGGNDRIQRVISAMANGSPPR